MLRYEYKYIIPLTKLGQLRVLIEPFMTLDKYAVESGGEYTVRSIYFDTPDLQCYFDKLAGISRRNKVRLRGYNIEDDEGTVFFELKKKVNEPLFKNRAKMTYEEARHLIEGQTLADDAQENARRFLYHLNARRMFPVVTVIYEREPYQFIIKEKNNDLRITFDKNLRAVAYPSLDDLYEEENAAPVLPGRFIMEIKFNQYLPAWVRAMVAGMGLFKGPASKYAMSIEALGLANGHKNHRAKI